MTAPKHQCDSRFFHRCNQLGQRQSRFNVATHRVQDNEKPVCVRAFLYGDQQGDDLLVFCCFLTVRQNIVPLDLSDDGQAVN